MHQTGSIRDAASVSVVFDYPFRIFFLSVAVLAALVVPLWTMLVTGSLTLPLAMPAGEFCAHVSCGRHRCSRYLACSG